MSRNRLTIGLLVIALAIGSVAAVNAISGRFSLAHSRSDKATALRSDTKMLLANLPATFDDDLARVKTAVPLTLTQQDLIDHATTVAASVGLTMVAPDPTVGAALSAQLLASLPGGGATPGQALTPVSTVLAVQGDFHQISDFLEQVDRSALLVVRSTVEFTFDSDAFVATFALAGLQFTADSPEQAVARAGRSTTNGTP
ncbi:unannotated protein [freshwater metagenome]|uniref:Unannotated protein n=1 Tax=freshwater metagenome TaxID=449393 RepID=A0A6J7FHF1_9ZZZZ|nr:hypothetical protein [Actinomycetota bacterium]